MLNYNNTILAKIDAGQKQATADAERAQALQADPSFWEPYEEPNKFECLKLWHAICAFMGVNPAHRDLSSPDYAARMERHSSGEVAARLKELLRLHAAALGGIKMGRLKAVGNEAKGFETDMDSLIEWAEKVGEVRPEPHPMKSAANSQTKHNDFDEATGEQLPEWLRETRIYIVGVMNDGKYGTAKALHKALEAKAGPNSPFEKGVGNNRDSLFVRTIACHVSVKTMQNNWRLLRSLI